MKTFRVVVVVVFLGLAIPATYRTLSAFTSSARGPSTYAVLDEIFTLLPAATIYERGYSTLSCRNGHTGSCYGGTQMLFDALKFHLAPRAWLLASEVNYGPTFPWSHLVKYPRMLELMRWSRLAYVGALLLALGLICWRLSRSWEWTVLSLGLLSASGAFANAWQGAKNDFPAGLWELLFLYGLCRTFAARKVNARAALFTFAVGLVGVLVRPILAPLLLVFPAVAALALFWERKSVRPPLLLLGTTGFTGAALYLALQPNSLVSSFEANWFLQFSRMPGRRMGEGDHVRELSIALPVLGLFAWQTVLSWRRRSDNGENLHLAGSAYLIFSAALLLYFNLKTAFFRQHYYLPSLLLIVVAIAAHWPTGKLLHTTTVVISALLGFALIASPKTVADAARSVTQAPSPFPIDAQGTWLVDIALRPAVPKEARGIEFFDSFTESPQALARRMGSALPQQILVTCWGSLDESARAQGLDAPAPAAWRDFLGGLCTTTEPITTDAFSPFVNVFRTRAYAILAGDAFRARPKSKESAYAGDVAPPRTWRGSVRHMDHYDQPLRLETPAQLEIEVAGFTEAELPLSSNCKEGNPSYEIELLQEGRRWRSGPLSAIVTDKFRADFPRLGERAWFGRWLVRLYELPTIQLSARPDPRHPVRIRFQSTNDNCLIVLGSLKRKNTLPASPASMGR